MEMSCSGAWLARVTLGRPGVGSFILSLCQGRTGERAPCQTGGTRPYHRLPPHDVPPLWPSALFVLGMRPMTSPSIVLGSHMAKLAEPPTLRLLENTRTRSFPFSRSVGLHC